MKNTRDGAVCSLLTPREKIKLGDLLLPWHKTFSGIDVIYDIVKVTIVNNVRDIGIEGVKISTSHG